MSAGGVLYRLSCFYAQFSGRRLDLDGGGDPRYLDFAPLYMYAYELHAYHYGT